MRNRGSIERDRRKGGDRWRIVFYVDGKRVRLNGRPRPSGGTSPFESEADALRALMELRAEAVSRDWPIERVVGLWRPNVVAVTDRVESRVAEHLEHFRGRVAAGQRSPTSLREIERYAKRGGHWSWWDGRSVHGITHGDVEDWHAWLAERGIGAKTQKNVSDAFRAFLRRLRRRGDVEAIPEFPTLEVPEHAPRVIDLETQTRILEAIPWERRGAYLLAAYEALRVSEVRALDLADWDGRQLFVGRAVQGPRLAAPVAHTKNRTAGYREVWHPELQRWLAWRTGEGRMLAPFAQALAWNPTAINRDKRWTPDPMEKAWNAACEAVGVSVTLQEGTRHTILTAAGAALPERLLRAFSRHRDGKSLGHYVKPTARATGAAMVRAIGAAPTTTPSDGAES